MEGMPGIISDRLRELRSEHSCKSGQNLWRVLTELWRTAIVA